MTKSYIVYCNYCNYKKIVSDPSQTGLVAAQQTTVQGGIPMRNKETGKIETRENVKCMPRVKCPDCGRAVTLRRNSVPDTKPYAPESEQDQII